jgi:hypothetical protein
VNTISKNGAQRRNSWSADPFERDISWRSESVIKRFMENSGVPRVKGLLFTIQSQEDLGKAILGSADNILKGMMNGEVKTIPI